MDELQQKFNRNPMTYATGLIRGHSDLEISDWIDKEGSVDLDRLTSEDIAVARRFFEVFKVMNVLVSREPL